MKSKAASYGDSYRRMLKRRERARAIQRRKCLEQTNMIMVYSKIFYVIGLICVSLAIATIATCVFMRQYYQNTLKEKDSQISQLQRENRELLDQIGEFSDTYNTTAKLLEDVSSVAYELDLENEQLVDQANELQSKLNTYEEREELFDKYEWAILRADNTRTDITYKRITSLEELVDERDLSNEGANLVLALAMTESRGTENAVNSESSARGFGQMLEGTARFTYEKLMGNGSGSYNHNMALDGDINLAMITYYLEYLGIKYSYNIDLVINEYRGETDLPYLSKLDGYLAKAGTSLHSIALRP